MVKKGAFDKACVGYTCLITGEKGDNLERFEESREKKMKNLNEK